MNKLISYTSEQLQGKFIACSVILDPPSLGAVIHAEGPCKGLPVLYHSINDAKSDSFFDDEWDHVIPAQKYYERIKTNNFKF
jgi:hypothetical protein